MESQPQNPDPDDDTCIILILLFFLCMPRALTGVTTTVLMKKILTVKATGITHDYSFFFLRLLNSNAAVSEIMH